MANPPDEITLIKITNRDQALTYGKWLATMWAAFRHTESNFMRVGMFLFQRSASNIKITSREQARLHGQLLARMWEAFLEADAPTMIVDSSTVVGGYEFIRPKKLKPLTDEELSTIFVRASTNAEFAECQYRAIRAAIEAHDKRKAEIAAAETPDELVDECEVADYCTAHPKVRWMAHIQNGRAYVKTYEFFKAEGGFDKVWGMRWFEVEAPTSKDAERVALQKFQESAEERTRPTPTRSERVALEKFQEPEE